MKDGEQGGERDRWKEGEKERERSEEGYRVESSGEGERASMRERDKER